MTATVASRPASLAGSPRKSAQNGTMAASATTRRVRTRDRRLQSVYGAMAKDGALSHLSYRNPMVKGHGCISNPSLALVVTAPTHVPHMKQNPLYLHGPERRVVLDLLKSIDVPEDRIYYTGLVKYQTPHDRSPRSVEIQASLPYLRIELDIVQPDVVIVMGRAAVEVLLPGIVLVHHHGMLVEGKRRYVPMFHPHAAMLNEDIRKAMFRGFARINKIL